MQIFLKYGEHNKTLGAKRVTSSQVHSEDPQALGAMATGTWDLCTPDVSQFHAMWDCR